MFRPLSASQIDQYLDCPRKWAFRYLDRLKRPKHHSAIVGSRVHELLEDWLRDGKAPNPDETLELDIPKNGLTQFAVGQMAMELIPHVPAPRTPGMKVEHKFGFTVQGVPFQGYVDVLYGLRVYDHKTTVDFRHAKTPDDLQDDTQANIYAAASMFETGSNYAHLQWNYVRTKSKPKVLPVCTTLPHSRVEEQFGAKILPTGRRILALYQEKPPAADVKPNTEACDKFGGCPYRSHCKLSISNVVRGKMSLLEDLRAGKFKKAAQQAEAEPSRQTELPLASGINPPETSVEPEPPAAAPEPTPEPEPPKKRGRPKGSKNKPKEEPSLTEPLFLLYVNCRPTKGTDPVVEFRDFIAPVLDTINVEESVVDYRAMEYGKGPATLEKYLQEYLKVEISGGLLAIDTRDQVAQHALPVLLQFADVVVRGFY